MKKRLIILLLLVHTMCLADTLIGKQAPEIHIKKWVTKNPPELSALDGKVIVLEFWATWCSPCIESIPHLIELNQQYQNTALEFISLSQDKTVEKVSRFVKQKEITYHVAIDNGTADWFRVRGYPTMIVVDAKGTVVWRGYPWSEGLQEVINQSLSKVHPPLLKGVDLGPFDKYKKDLIGGRNFAKAYQTIQRISAQKNAEHQALATKIIQTIDRELDLKIQEYLKLTEEDPIKARKRFEKMIRRYNGIEAMKPAYDALKQMNQHVADSPKYVMAK